MQTLISSNASRTSIFVTAMRSMPLIIAEYRSATASNQPQRRGPARGRAVLMADGPKTFTRGIVELGGEGAVADARGVRLDDAQ